MADTLQFDLVSPERNVVSVAANSVQIPGMDGDLTATPRHAPFLTTLRPGVVRVMAGGQATEYVVTGGFAEVTPEATTILAEKAVPRAEANGAMLAEVLAEAERLRDEAPQERRMAAHQRVSDVRVLQSRLGT
jgi:F-type H+-transporting ATPase subunit epsilon